MQVQKLRLQHGWSQQQLAELSGLSVRTIQRIERGQPASMETLKSLASVFEIDFSQFTSEPVMEAIPNTANSNEETLAFQHVYKLKRFYLHVGQYAVVMLFLLAINLLTRPHNLWVVWPALGWGIGLALHAISTFELLPFFGAEWERRQVEKRLGRPL
ncbi:2TM domain-containing protein [Derxia lacustris]|uniref:2TM domain-containing protein n=1 Tax=Derxia lacustris TaxID=764842 RepID=UPI000A16D0CF|nr:2TM domain-containing protein [Derxia lacustris]